MHIYVCMMSINSWRFSKIIIIVQLSKQSKMMRLAVFAAVLAIASALYTGEPQLAQVLRSDSDIAPDGTYQYGYETENGISAQESGVPRPIGPETPVVASGSYGYTGPEGERVEISYVADENGYQPQGNVLPTSPPVPAAILRGLEYINAHPPPPETTRR